MEKIKYNQTCLVYLAISANPLFIGSRTLVLFVPFLEFFFGFFYFLSCCFMEFNNRPLFLRPWLPSPFPVPRILSNVSTFSRVVTATNLPSSSTTTDESSNLSSQPSLIENEPKTSKTYVPPPPPPYVGQCHVLGPQDR